MKAQVITIAAMALAANVAFAANSTQSTSAALSNSLESIITHAASTSNASVKASTSTGNSIQDLANTLNKEATMDLRKGGVINTAAGSMSAVGAFTVTAVASTVKGSTQVTDFVLTGAVKGSRLVLRVTKPIAMGAAKGVDSSAQATLDGAEYVAKQTYKGAKIVGGAVVDGTKYVARKTINVGTGVLVGLSASGAVLIEDIGDATKAGAKSQSLTSAAILLGSASHSAQAFGSEVVQGFRK